MLGEVQVRPGTTSQESSPTGVTKDVLKCSAGMTCNNRYKCVYQGSMLKTEYKAFYRGLVM